MRGTKVESWAQCALLAAMAGGALLWSQPSLAVGAIAVGIAPGGVIKGFAGGHAFNAPDAEKARQGAINGCHKSTGAPKTAQDACAVVATFKDQCYAIAIDPKDGTPGAGWAVDETQAIADSEALQQCRNTSPADRKNFCIVPATNHGCDGDAK